MTSIFASVKGFVADEEGVTAIEYALIAALISVVAVATMRDIGTAISNKFTDIKTSLS